MQELLDKYGAIEQEESKRRASLRAEGLEGLATILSSNSAFKTLRLSGYTPSFNDGDPCVHRQSDIVINGYSRYGAENYEEKAQLPQPDKEELKKLSNVVSKMEPVFSGGFGTNWEIVLTRGEDGSVDWSLDPDYDCGY